MHLRSAQKPIDRTIPIDRQDQKQITETITIAIGRSQHESAVLIVSINRPDTKRIDKQFNWKVRTET